MSDIFLFYYGTLRLPDVQMALFGRRVEGAPDALPGLSRRLIEIDDPDVIAKSARAGIRWPSRAMRMRAARWKAWSFA